MPNLRPDELEQLASEILQVNGVSVRNADIVASHLVSSNLGGHDSHGVIRLRRYEPLIVSGHIKPDAAIAILGDGRVTATVKGNWGLGFVVMVRAVVLAVEKAKTYGCATIAVRRQSRIGRLAPYSEAIARNRMIGLVTADFGRAPKSVAPHGGRTRLPGANPISIAVPSGDGPPASWTGRHQRSRMGRSEWWQPGARRSRGAGHRSRGPSHGRSTCHGAWRGAPPVRCGSSAQRLWTVIHG